MYILIARTPFHKDAINRLFLFGQGISFLVSIFGLIAALFIKDANYIKILVVGSISGPLFLKLVMLMYNRASKNFLYLDDEEFYTKAHSSQITQSIFFLKTRLWKKSQFDANKRMFSLNGYLEQQCFKKVYNEHPIEI